VTGPKLPFSVALGRYPVLSASILGLIRKAVIHCLWVGGVAWAANPIVPEVTIADGAAEAAGTMGLDAAAIVGEPAGPPLGGLDLEAATKSVGSLLRCPTCQGMSVYDSPAEGARAMRSEVERMLERGFSQEQVLDYFRAGYGDFILLEPRKEGANWLLWAGPVGLGVLGGLSIALRLSKKKPAVVAERSADSGEKSADSATKGGDSFRDQVEREVSQ